MILLHILLHYYKFLIILFSFNVKIYILQEEEEEEDIHMYDEVDDLDPDSIEVVTIRLNDIQLVLVHNMLGLPLFNVTLNATNLDIKKEQGKMEG